MLEGLDNASQYFIVQMIALYYRMKEARTKHQVSLNN